MRALLPVFISILSITSFSLLASSSIPESANPHAAQGSRPVGATRDASVGAPSLDRTNPNYQENDYNSPCPVGDCDSSGNNYPDPRGNPHPRDSD
jgi:hypothetical protein